MRIVYTRENGYGNIDVHSEPFQLGRRLYEAQCIVSDIRRGKEIAPDRVEELARRYCELVSHVGQLRADYQVMRSVAEGKAEFRER